MKAYGNKQQHSMRAAKLAIWNGFWTDVCSLVGSVLAYKT